MTRPVFHVDKAQNDDADAIAGVFSPSLRLLTFLPELHTVDEDRQFIRHRILKHCDVSVVRAQTTIVSFIALEAASPMASDPSNLTDEIRLLHTHPDWIGCGAGSLLIKHAQQTRHCLELWCFQANIRARQFYERHGFAAVRFTDGEQNEERMPDVRYRWQRC